MKLEIYSVFDKKALVYGRPFFLLNDATAIRAFTDLVNDPSTDVNRHPSDYQLFHVGSFEDTTGGLIGLDTITPMVNGNEVVAIQSLTPST